MRFRFERGFDALSKGKKSPVDPGFPAVDRAPLTPPCATGAVVSRRVWILRSTCRGWRRPSSFEMSQAHHLRRVETHGYDWIELDARHVQHPPARLGRKPSTQGLDRDGQARIRRWIVTTSASRAIIAPHETPRRKSQQCTSHPRAFLLLRRLDGQVVEISATAPVDPVGLGTGVGDVWQRRCHCPAQSTVVSTQSSHRFVPTDRSRTRIDQEPPEITWQSRTDRLLWERVWRRTSEEQARKEQDTS